MYCNFVTQLLKVKHAKHLGNRKIYLLSLKLVVNWLEWLNGIKNES